MGTISEYTEWQAQKLTLLSRLKAIKKFYVVSILNWLFKKKLFLKNLIFWKKKCLTTFNRPFFPSSRPFFRCSQDHGSVQGFRCDAESISPETYYYYSNGKVEEVMLQMIPQPCCQSIFRQWYMQKQSLSVHKADQPQNCLFLSSINFEPDVSNVQVYLPCILIPRQ